MAFCQVCNKSKQYGHNVSHSKRRTKRVFMPNVFRKRMRVVKTQTAKLKTQKSVNGVKWVKICAKCLKRVKKFGFIKARKEAKLSNNIIQLVDWLALREKKLEEERIRAEARKVAAKEEEKEKKEKKKEKEISVEELVGRK